MGTSWTDFRPQLERLPDLLPSYWSIIAFDAPGRGKSTPPHEVMPLDAFERNAAAAGDVLDALGVTKYSLLGWSSGGATAIHLAAQRPKQVEKLILLNGFTHITAVMLDFFESEFKMNLTNILRKKQVC